MFNWQFEDVIFIVSLGCGLLMWNALRWNQLFPFSFWHSSSHMQRQTHRGELLYHLGTRHVHRTNKLIHTYILFMDGFLFEKRNCTWMSARYNCPKSTPITGLGNVWRPKKGICTPVIGVYASPHIKGIFLIIFFVLIILLMQSELELSAE